MGRYPEADLTKVKRYSIAKRKSKVGKGNLAGVPDPARPLKDFIKGLPDVLRARDLREIAAAVNTARRKKRPVLLMMGAHPVKCGLNPVIIDLMKRGFITGLATNGAGAIHDFELACWGRTSEDVQIGLEDGSFGMARETADLINGAVIQGDAQDLGFGETLGLMLNEGRFPFINHSLLAEGYRLKIPVTVHVALGTDIIHQHPSADGAAIGSASHRDFRILAEAVRRGGHQPGVVGDPAGGLFKGPDRGPQPGASGQKLHHRQLRHDPALPPQPQRGPPPDLLRRPGVFHHRPP